MSLLIVATMCLLYSHYRTYGYNDYDGDFVDNALRNATPNADAVRDLPIQWNAELEDGDFTEADDYFDRVVMVGLQDPLNPSHPPHILTTGVLLDEDRVLTSYNPYRAIVKQFRTNELVVALLTGKLYNDTTKRHKQLIEYYTVECHSQVPTTSEAMLTNLQWHGEVKVHSPVHDLFILRITKKLNLILSRYFKEYTVTGPKTIPIANVKHWLGPNVKFASLGYKSKAEIKRHDTLSIKQYEEDDQPMTNCNEWMIRDWGRFLCLENKDLNKGIGSGAVLVFNETLVGIGSFTLKKGNSSIFVFTDVRRYSPVIDKKCYKPPLNSTAATTQ